MEVPRLQENERPEGIKGEMLVLGAKGDQSNRGKLKRKKAEYGNGPYGYWIY